MTQHYPREWFREYSNKLNARLHRADTVELATKTASDFAPSFDISSRLPPTAAQQSDLPDVGAGTSKWQSHALIPSAWPPFVTFEEGCQLPLPRALQTLCVLSERIEIALALAAASTPRARVVSVSWETVSSGADFDPALLLQLRWLCPDLYRLSAARDSASLSAARFVPSVLIEAVSDIGLADSIASDAAEPAQTAHVSHASAEPTPALSVLGNRNRHGAGSGRRSHKLPSGDRNTSSHSTLMPKGKTKSSSHCTDRVLRVGAAAAPAVCRIVRARCVGLCKLLLCGCIKPPADTVSAHNELQHTVSPAISSVSLDTVVTAWPAEFAARVVDGDDVAVIWAAAAAAEHHDNRPSEANPLERPPALLGAPDNVLRWYRHATHRWADCHAVHPSSRGVHGMSGTQYASSFPTSAQPQAEHYLDASAGNSVDQQEKGLKVSALLPIDCPWHRPLKIALASKYASHDGGEHDPSLESDAEVADRSSIASGAVPDSAPQKEPLSNVEQFLLGLPDASWYQGQLRSLALEEARVGLLQEATWPWFRGFGALMLRSLISACTATRCSKPPVPVDVSVVTTESAASTSICDCPPPLLRSHQGVALDSIRQGAHVVVSTGTASGKSLCYQLPLLAIAVLCSVSGRSTCGLQDSIGSVQQSGRPAAPNSASLRGRRGSRRGKLAALQSLVPVVAAPSPPSASGVASARETGMLSVGSQGTALYLAPTKALARDQHRVLTESLQRLSAWLAVKGVEGASDDCTGIAEDTSGASFMENLLQRLDDSGLVNIELARVAAIDGDTPHAARASILNRSNVMVSNPDFVHATMLSKREWRPFLSNLRLVVIDEGHAYRGSFGGHVSCVFRRLRRAVYLLSGRNLQFVMCSASLEDGSGHLTALTGVGEDDRSSGPIVHISESGAPRGERYVATWLPPYVPTEARHVGLSLKEKELLEGDHVLSHQAFAKPPGKRSVDSAYSDGSDADQCDELTALSAVCEDSSFCPELHASESIELETSKAATDAPLRNDVTQSDVERKEALVPIIKAPSRRQLRRMSPFAEASSLAFALMTLPNPVKLFVFTGVRQIAELIATYLTRRLRQRKFGHLAGTVKVYRGGYTPGQRRHLERAMSEGALRCVITTNALELGVDVGNLDAVISVGWPGSSSSLAQQFGRAGRGVAPCLCVFLPMADALNEALTSSAEGLCDLPPSPLTVAFTEPGILGRHVLLSKAEFGDFGAEEPPFLPARPEELLHTLRDLQVSSAKDVPIRDPGGFKWTLIDEETGRTLEVLQGFKVHCSVYHGAVFFHQMVPFEIAAVDTETFIATCRRLRDGTDYFTKPRDHTSVHFVATLERAGVCGPDCVSCTSFYSPEVDAEEVPASIHTPTTAANRINAAEGHSGQDMLITPSRAGGLLGIVPPHTPKDVPGLDHKTALEDDKKGIRTSMDTDASATNNADDAVVDRVESGEPRPFDPSALLSTLVHNPASLHSSLRGPLSACVGIVQVTFEVYGHMKVWTKTGEIADVITAPMPPTSFETSGMWVSVMIGAGDPAWPNKSTFKVEGLHGLVHTLLSLVPLVVSVDPGDLHCADAITPDGRPYFCIFDAGAPGSAGSHGVFSKLGALLPCAAGIIRGCNCIAGCTGCLLSQTCGCYNAAIDKNATIAVLDLLHL